MPEDPIEPPRAFRAGGLARLASRCVAHPWRTVLVWAAAALVVAGLAVGTGGSLVDTFQNPGAESQRAQDLLTERFPSQAGDAATVVFTSAEGLRAGTRRAAVEAAVAAAGQGPRVVGVGDPFARAGGDVSASGTIAYADVQFDAPAADLGAAPVEALQERVRDALAGSGVRAEFGGAAVAADAAVGGLAELLGLLAAVVILLVFLRSLVAMAVPIVLALLTVGLALAAIIALASVVDFNTATPTLAIMLGLGVGIDYALFVVTRYRAALHVGVPPRDAAMLATSTAGRAVIFAGVFVAISISGLAVVGLSFITLLGVGAAIAVAIAVIATVTLLPAVLALLGHRIDRGRLPGRRPGSLRDPATTLSGRLVRRVTRRPWLAVLGSLLVIGTLAAPAIGVRLGSADAGSAPTSDTRRQAYDLLVQGFGPGFNAPLLIAVDQADDPGAAHRLEVAVGDTSGVATITPPVVNEAGDTATLIAYPTTSPQSAATSDLVALLRDQVIPAALAGSPARAYVGGQTAVFDDIATRVGGRLPVFLLLVVGITLVGITMAFRSVAVAIKAGLSTTLSALAAFGVVVAVFQYGWGSELVGLDRSGPIETFLPIIVFAILFGLSMDYEVFLASRIREEHVHGAPARVAVRRGVEAIGGVIMAAGAIMCVVFFSFVLEDDRVIKGFGLALGTAILVDAFLVRLILVPAVMHLLAERAWWIPRWLDRLLPSLTIEPPTPAPERPRAQAVARSEA